MSGVLAFFGQALLHSLWVWVPVVLAWRGLLRLAPAQAAKRRYRISVGALVALTCLPLVVALASLSPRGDAPGVVRRTGELEEVLEIEGLLSDASHSQGPGSVPPVAENTFDTAAASPRGHGSNGWRNLPQAVRHSAATSLPVLAVLWLLTTTLGLAALARRMRRLESTLFLSTRPLGKGLSKAFDQLARRMGVRRDVQFSVGPHLPGPCTVGWRRPHVLLPEVALKQLDRQALEAVVAHELEHVRRSDWTRSIAMEAIKVLFVFHPLCRVLVKSARRELEHGCDDRAVRECGSAALYAHALATLEEQRIEEPQAATCPQAMLPMLGALGASEGPLLERIRRLASPAAARPAPRTRIAGLSLFALALLIAAGGTAVAVQAGPGGRPRVVDEVHERLVLREGEVVTLIERDRNSERHLRFTPGENGLGEYAYTVNGRSTPVDDAVRSWFELTLEEVRVPNPRRTPQSP